VAKGVAMISDVNPAGSGGAMNTQTENYLLQSQVNARRLLESLRRSLAHDGSPPCRWCGRRTYSPGDIEHKYCSCCGGAYLPKDCEHRPMETILDTIEQGAWD